jgi:hypothetical protein
MIFLGVYMFFNGKEIDPAIFKLEDDRLNSQGLNEYAWNISENLGVKYCSPNEVNVDGKTIKTLDYLKSMNCPAIYNPIDGVIISPKCFDEGLTEKQYRVTKGVIDHETGHIFWFDSSYLPDNNENDGDRESIHTIGSIIDDLRIEHRMINEFGVDGNNFKLCFEQQNTFSESELDIEFQDPTSWLGFYILINKIYRGIDISFLGNRKFPGKLLYLESRFKSIIDSLIISDDRKVADAAREIFELLSEENNKIIKIIKKIDGNSYEVDINGKRAWLVFYSQSPCNWNESDNIPVKELIDLFEFVEYLQTVPPEGR